MAIDANVVKIARERLAYGEAALSARRATVLKREQYVRGEQELPFAPKGVNKEYMALREQAIANWTELYVSAPVQRLAVTGIRANIGADDDERNVTNSQIWTWFQANKWGKQQSTVFESIMKHGIGIVLVMPNPSGGAPVMRPQSVENVYLHFNALDPMVTDWAVKIVDVPGSINTRLALPAGVARDSKVAIVYDDRHILRFELNDTTNGAWKLMSGVVNSFKRVPFATFDYKARSNGEPWSGLDHMMVQQDALNTIRFNMLLAMQFSAFRQRVITGFDPRVVDEFGQIMYRTNEDGTPKLDDNGQPIPVLVNIGKAGVDRILTFPGVDTKVFDLPESNLANYTLVYDNFLSAFFATGQIPTQYMPQKLSNLTGDALAGAESAFASLIKEIQRAADEGVTEAAELAWIAAGNNPAEWNPAAEASWADAEARSFSQIVDAVTKLIAVDFPHRAGFEMIPGATDQKVNTWMEQREAEAFTTELSRIERPFADVTGI